MAKDRYWAARALDILEQKVDRSRIAMNKRLSSPVQRRANTSDLVRGLVLEPEAASPEGRATLLDFAKDFYGSEVANTIMAPYILGDEQPLPEEVV